MTYKVWIQETNPNVAGTDQFWLTVSNWVFRQGTATAGVWTDITTEFGYSDYFQLVTNGFVGDLTSYQSSSTFYPIGQGGVMLPLDLEFQNGYPGIGVASLIEYTREAASVEIIDPIDPPVAPPDGWPMLPLQQYKGQRQIQDELRWLTIQMYSQLLLSQVQEIETYGAPHLGSLALIQRFLSSDGLALLNDGDLSKVRMLLKAWKHLNPERGLHFIKLYLTVLFGNGNYTIDQMWQRKGKPYPEYLLSRSEITEFGESEDDYYLTSRVRVNLPVATAVPARVVGALRSAVSARLVMQVATSASGENTMRIGSAVNVAKRFSATNIIHFTATSRATDSL